MIRRYLTLSIGFFRRVDVFSQRLLRPIPDLTFALISYITVNIN